MLRAYLLEVVAHVFLGLKADHILEGDQRLLELFLAVELERRLEECDALSLQLRRATGALVAARSGWDRRGLAALAWVGW